MMKMFPNTGAVSQETADRAASSRLWFLDLLRGINLISMIAYHGAYDLVYLYGVNRPGDRGLPGYLWQQSICWLFIFLSGCSFWLGRFHGGRRVKRGLLLTACGLLITAVTALVMPQSLIIMGVLSFFGLAVLLTALLYPLFTRIPAPAGLICCLLLFFLTRDVPSGYLGFEGLRLCALPDFLYRGVFMMILGFPWPGFFSTDYFSLLPSVLERIFYLPLHAVRTRSVAVAGLFQTPSLPFSGIHRKTYSSHLYDSPARADGCVSSRPGNRCAVGLFIDITAVMD